MTKYALSRGFWIQFKIEWNNIIHLFLCTSVVCIYAFLFHRRFFFFLFYFNSLNKFNDKPNENERNDETCFLFARKTNQNLIEWAKTIEVLWLFLVMVSGVCGLCDKMNDHIKVYHLINMEYTAIWPFIFSLSFFLSNMLTVLLLFSQIFKRFL